VRLLVLLLVEEVVVDDALERLANGLTETRELLAEGALEPDRQRTDWGEHRDEVDALVALFESEVLDLVDDVAEELDDEQQFGLRGTVQTDGASIVAVLHAAGRSTDALALISRLRKVTTDEPAASLRAAEADLDAYARLDHAGWALTNGDRRRAESLAKALLATKPPDIIAEGAQAIVDAPEPLSKAPQLFRWNGFGVGLYGARDRRGDTHVSTHCISALWVPIIPLSAYRVTNHGDDSYTFYAKEKLSSFAIWARRAVAIGVVLIIAGLWANSYLNSPNRKAGKAIASAKSAADAGDIDTAIARYEGVIADYGTKADRDVLGGASKGLAELYAAGAPNPFGVNDVPFGVRAIRRYEALPVRVRTQEATAVMVGHVDTWADQLGTGDSAAIQAASSLLDAVIPVATDANIRGPATRRNALSANLAESIAGAWPLAALALYVDLDTDDAIVSSAEIVEKLSYHPSLLRSANAVIGAWLARAERVSAVEDTRVRASEAVAAASAGLDDELRTGILAGRDDVAMVLWLEAHPKDQEVAVAMAGILLATGKADEARVALETLGLPGWLVPDAQQLLAAIYAETGSLDEADALLTDVLLFRLPRFVAASHAYTVTAREREEALIRKAELGQLPTSISLKLNNATSDEEARAMFGAWLGEQLDTDAELAGLRKTYLAYSDVVSMSVSLGSYKLRRALGATGDERTTLLSEAENAFLAIRQDAEGMPQFHLGLGQVYYRLGRKDDGEAEFASVLAHEEPELDMLAAHAYRDLGNVARSREIAERVFESGKKPFSDTAAVLLGLIARSTDDAEMWFSRADQSQPFVKTSLLEVKARRLFDEGNAAEAAQVMGEAAAFHEKDAAISATAANNAAVAHSFIYACTGNFRTLQKAVASFDAAVKLDPQSALTVGNAADAHFRAGMLEVLGAWINPKALRLSSEASSTVDALLSGPERAKVLAALKANASIARAMTLTEQEMALAPNRGRSFDRALLWYAWTRDATKLTLLREQLTSRGVDIDDAESIRGRAAHVSGEDDDQDLAALAQHADRLRAALERVGGDKRSSAVGYMLLSQTLGRIAYMKMDITDARAAVTASRAARKAWPAIDNGRTLSRTLVLLAALEAPAAAEAIKSDSRIYSIAGALYKHSTDAQAMLAAVRKTEAFSEAVRLRKAVTDGEATITDWFIGALAGDSDLTAQGTTFFTDELQQLRLAIDLELDSTSPRLLLQRELSKANGG
jgi:hypothetical protein